VGKIACRIGAAMTRRVRDFAHASSYRLPEPDAWALSALSQFHNIVLWFHVHLESSMKTAVEIPDNLYRRAKVEAAHRGCKLKDLVEEGLRLVLESPHTTRRRPSLAELMDGARGVVDSGVPDLASNTKHLTSFGREARRRR
jgi:hypothetical protein